MNVTIEMSPSFFSLMISRNRIPWKKLNRSIIETVDAHDPDKLLVLNDVHKSFIIVGVFSVKVNIFSTEGQIDENELE